MFLKQTRPQPSIFSSTFTFRLIQSTVILGLLNPFPLLIFPHTSLISLDMATEEPIAAAAAPTPPPTLPHYPELILAAIEAVDDKNGANKSTISRQIEATYGNLPAGHTTLLSHHLNKMKQSGQLIMLKNNYLKPDPNAPPRRGRGRPPKPKSDTATPQDSAVSPSRPRGRPPKPVDPLSPPPEKKTPAVSGRKRGRPPKTVKTTAAVATPKVAPPSGAPRGRGRPPKVKPGVTAPVGA